MAHQCPHFAPRGIHRKLPYQRLAHEARGPGDNCYLRAQPRTAASMAATSIFFIGIIALNAR